MTIHDKLATIQHMMRAPKDKKNDFGGYKYRNAEMILAAFKALWIEGASLICTDSVCEVAGQIFITATARLTIGDESVEAQGHAMHPLQKKGMDASQITGSASSYARKYALCGLFAIEDESQDPDSRDNREEQGQTPPPKDPDAIRDGLLTVVSAAESTDDLNNRIGSAKFDAAWKWLADNHEDHSFDVRRAVDAVRDKFSPPQEGPDAGDGHEGDGAP